MTKQEYKELIKSTYPCTTGEIKNPNVMVIPLTNGLLKIIDIGLKKIKEEITE